MAKQTVLDLAPGYLNDFNTDDIDQESIDYQSESPESIAQRMRDKIFSANKFKTSGTLIGILLRVTDKYDSDCTEQDVAVGVAKPGAQRYGLNTYKIRIPELHFMLPNPEHLPESTTKDKLAIDSYPTMQSIDTYVQTQGAVPGDLVKVELANKGALTRMFFAGPLDPKITGMNAEDLKKCIDACKKQYSGSGSPGDCIGKNANLIKLDEVSPLVNGAGHTEQKVILGDAAPSDWLKGNIVSLKDKQFDGVSWIGVLGGNGPNDDKEMIENHTGRNTLIFMPKGIDTKQNVELVYFFHDNLKFSRSVSEWVDMGQTMVEMVSKKEQFNNGRRNIIFVIPEMPWSKENVTADYGYPRLQSTTDKAIGEEQYRYKDRHKMIWTSPDSDLEKFHKDVLDVLSNKFDLGDGKNLNVSETNITHITLAAQGYGVAAITFAAKQKLLKKTFKQLYKIQLLHGGNLATGTENFSDNDLMAIIQDIDGKKVEVEIHVSSKGDLGDIKLSRDSATAFIGAVSNSVVDWANASKKSTQALVSASANPNDLVKQLVKDLSTKAASQKENIFKSGKAFYASSKERTLRMSAAWAFIIFRGVSEKSSFKWVGWIADNTTVPTAVAAGESATTVGNVIVPPSTDTYKNTKVTKGYINMFKEVPCRTLLFSSPNSSREGITAIVVPRGTDLSKSFELIYFFHGFGGGNHKQGLSKNMLTKLNAMVASGRNIVYVATQLNVAKGASNDTKATFRPDSGKSFIEFHKDVIHYLEATEKGKGLAATGKAKFINFKAYSGGYHSLEGVVSQLSAPSVGGIPIQRIDYLDASYKFKTVRDKVYGDWKTSANPGTKFEILVFCTSNPNNQWATYGPVKPYHKTEGAPADAYNGNKKIEKDGKEATYSQLQGLFINKGGASHGNVFYKFIDYKSLLPDKQGVADPSFKPLDKVDVGTKKIDPKNIPVSYDKDGNAWNKDGEMLPDDYDLPVKDLKCTKDQIKNHTAKTKKPQAQKDCEKACRDRAKGKEPEEPAFDPKDANKIENPFNGLAGVLHQPNFKSSKKKRDPSVITSIVIHEGGLSLKGTIKTLNKNHYGTHFQIAGGQLVTQHVDIERRTAHAGQAWNTKSIGIDLVYNHVTQIGGSYKKFKDARDDPEKLKKIVKKKRLGSSLQIIKTLWDNGDISIIPNAWIMEKTYQLILALKKKYPSIKKQVPAASASGITFSHAGSSTNGIVAHKYISGKRTDGQWTQVYVALRLTGKTSSAAYRRMLVIAWKSSGWDSPEHGDTTKGYPQSVKSKAKRRYPL